MQIAGLTRMFIGNLVAPYAFAMTSEEQSSKSMEGLVRTLDEYVDWLCGNVPHFPIRLRPFWFELVWRWPPRPFPPPPPPPNGEPYPIGPRERLAAGTQFQEAAHLLEHHALQAVFDKASTRLITEAIRDLEAEISEHEIHA